MKDKGLRMPSNDPKTYLVSAREVAMFLYVIPPRALNPCFVLNPVTRAGEMRASNSCWQASLLWAAEPDKEYRTTSSGRFAVCCRLTSLGLLEFERRFNPA